MKLSKQANGIIIKNNEIEIAIAYKERIREFWMKGSVKEILKILNEKNRINKSNN